MDTTVRLHAATKTAGHLVRRPPPATSGHLGPRPETQWNNPTHWSGDHPRSDSLSRTALFRYDDAGSIRLWNKGVAKLLRRINPVADPCATCVVKRRVRKMGRQTCRPSAARSVPVFANRDHSPIDTPGTSTPAERTVHYHYRHAFIDASTLVTVEA